MLPVNFTCPSLLRAHGGQATAPYPLIFQLLAGTWAVGGGYLNHGGESLELRRAQINVLGRARLAMGLAKGLGVRPVFKGLLRFPGGVGGKQGIVVEARALQQVKFPKTGDLIEIGLAVFPDGDEFLYT